MQLKRINWRYLLFIIVFTLVSFEALLRIFNINDTYLERIGKNYSSYWGRKINTWYWTNSPNTSYSEKNIDFTYINKINSLGFRELDAEQIFKDSTTRTIVLGDSFTEGVGAVYDSSFPRHLQRLLDEQAIPVSIYNAGNSGSDPLFCYTVFRDMVVRQMHPDVVILVINSSDYNDLIYRGGFERFQADSITVFKNGPWMEPLFHHCYVFRFVLNTFLDYQRGDLCMNEENYEIACREANRTILATADSFQALAAQHHFKLLFVTHPVPSELIYDSPVNEFINELLRDLTNDLSAAGYNAINIYEPLAQAISEENILRYGFRHDGHFSSEGYKLMAHAIWQETQKKYPLFWQTKKALYFTNRDN